jgi:proline dehydrogenase
VQPCPVSDAVSDTRHGSFRHGSFARVLAVGSRRVSDLGATVSSLPRAALLHAADNERLQHLVQHHGRRLGAGRFVAGETLDECVRVLRGLNDAGLYANTTLLGEAIPDEAGAAAVTDEYGRIAERLVAERLKANIALKLTHLGLSFDEETAYENVVRLVARAGELGTFVRLDMEQSDYVDGTLRIYERLRAAGLESVGTVLQAYLYRTADDLGRLLPSRPNLRIVKGAYLEPASIAYPEKRDVDRAYVKLVQRGLREGAYIAVATHDERIIRFVQRFAAREDVPRDRFEFQMLYGVRPALQRSIAAEGYKVLVAAPYGPDWYPYFMRRLAERPANVTFFLRNLVRR